MQSASEIQLSNGPIRYRDSGTGEPVLFLHGVLANGLLWRKVVPLLEGRARCVVPDLPLGAHETPMPESTDLSPRGIARMIAELISALQLGRVTIVGCDTGGAIAQLLLSEQPEVAARVVLTSCDCFDHFFPPLFKPLQLAARVPGGLTAALQPLRLRAARRLPIAFGRLTKRPIPDEVTDAWLEPFFTQPGIRRDAARFIRAVDERDTIAAAERLANFPGPALVAWAAEDRVFPPALGRRLARSFANGRFEEIEDSYTFVPEDQPGRLAELITELIAVPASGSAPTDVR